MKEPLDRNKTDLTHFVIACAIGYLANRGFHPIETEVAVASGWIADIASFCYPTPMEMKNLGIKAQRLRIESDYGEIQFEYGHLLTALVEVKTTKADFKKDLNKKFSGQKYPAHLCYLAYPKDMNIDATEIPMGWIGLEVYPSERTIRKFRSLMFRKKGYWSYSSIHPQHPGEVADFIAQIAIKREYRTKYAANRAWLKMYRAKGGFE